MYSTFHKAFRQSILSPPFANEAKHTFMSAAVTRIQTRGGLRTQKQNDFGKKLGHKLQRYLIFRLHLLRAEACETSLNPHQDHPPWPLHQAP